MAHGPQWLWRRTLFVLKLATCGSRLVQKAAATGVACTSWPPPRLL